MKHIATSTALFVLATVLTDAQARAPSAQECREGGEFIGNAALSRDVGVPREIFVGQLDADLQAIRAFPPDLRWFAQNADDEKLLRAAVLEVFDRPDVPAQHRVRFEAKCLAQGAGVSGRR